MNKSFEDFTKVHFRVQRFLLELFLKKINKPTFNEGPLLKMKFREDFF